MHRIFCAILLGSLMAVLPLSAQQGQPSTPSTAPFQILWDVRIPMRDGVTLCGTVFRPANQKGPLPVILAMTPYTLQFTAEWGRFFARNGYVFVSVDMRGRGDSEGHHTPMIRDPQDGFDTVEWLAKQSWCNGKVGMTGLSYLGGTQWATAKLRPPHLATIVPIAATHPGVDLPTLGGIHFIDTMEVVLRTSGKSRKGGSNAGNEYWDGTAHDFIRSGLQWKELDAFFGLPSPVFQTWLRHPAHDAYWKAATPTVAEYGKINIPILTITGHYDDDQIGAMTYYRDHMRHGAEEAKDRHFLVIGPWEHMQTRTPALEYEGVTFGPASMLDMNALHLAWFDWTLKNGPRPAFLEKRVACYIQTSDTWRRADRLENLNLNGQNYYLHPSGVLDTTRPSASVSQRFTHDPMDLTSLEWDRRPVKGGLLVQSDATMVTGKRQFHGDALTYLSEPMAAPTTICGSPTFTVWIRMDVPDEDFFAALHEVKADGTTQQLGWDCLRTRYRESFEKERLVKPEEPTRLVFQRFPIIGKQFAKGSRLKLVFGSMNLPWAQRNYHSGKAVAIETPKDARVAHVEVMNDAEHFALLVVPLGETKSLLAEAQRMAASKIGQ